MFDDDPLLDATIARRAQLGLRLLGMLFLNDEPSRVGGGRALSDPLK
jgi:hypothetical protein